MALEKRFPKGQNMSTDKPRVGFVGLGLMGHGIAKNLITKGFPLTVRLHRNRGPAATCWRPAQRK